MYKKKKKINNKNKIFDKIISKYRINKDIKSKKVKLVGNKNIKNKIYYLNDLLKKIKNKKLDIIEINNKVKPTIVKVINFNKFIYKIKKKYKKNIDKSNKNKIKIIRLSPNINDYDINYKIIKAKKFLKKNNKVIFYVFFKGRSIIYKYIGEKTLEKIYNFIKKYGFIQKKPFMEKNKMFMIILPINKKKKINEKK